MITFLEDPRICWIIRNYIHCACESPYHGCSTSWDACSLKHVLPKPSNNQVIRQNLIIPHSECLKSQIPNQILLPTHYSNIKIKTNQLRSPQPKTHPSPPNHPTTSTYTTQTYIYIYNPISNNKSSSPPKKPSPSFSPTNQPTIPTSKKISEWLHFFGMGLSKEFLS